MLRSNDCFPNKEKSKDEIQKDFDRVLDFADLDYWSCTWCFQEVALARSTRFVFGSKAFTMGQLKKLFECFGCAQRVRDRMQRYHMRRMPSAVIVAPDLFHVATIGNREEKGTRLTLALQEARLLQGHNPKGRVYGFLGIMIVMFGGRFVEPERVQYS